MIIPVGFAQVNLVFTGSALPEGAEVTFGVDNTVASITAGGIAGLFDGIYDASGIRANLSTGVNMTEIRVKLGPNATGPTAEEAAGGTGTGGTPGLPNAAWLCTKVTALGGRAAKGRMFFPGIPEASVGGDGQIDSGAVVAMQADVQAFLAGCEAADLAMVLLHSAGSPISTPTPVTSLHIETLAATQRRRMRR